MKDWTKTFAEDLWLKPDEVGADEADFIRRALRLRKGSKVLDAPCGAGRIAIHLAHAGCVVTGIDLRASFIQRAEARFRDESQEGRFQVMDLREISFESEFDGIYSWLGSFGYFTDSENADVMRRYVAALRPGGRLLIDQINREFMLRHFIECHTSGDRTNKNKWNPKTKWVESDWIVRRGGASEHNRLSMRLYTPREMGDLFTAAGLTVERMYGSKSGEPYQRGSKRLIVVGEEMILTMENSTRPECRVQKGSTER